MTRTGRYRVEGTDQAAAGIFAASRLSKLTPLAARDAVARLLARGEVERVTVRVRADGRDGGRLAAGLRLIAS